MKCFVRFNYNTNQKEKTIVFTEACGFAIFNKVSNEYRCWKGCLYWYPLESAHPMKIPKGGACPWGEIGDLDWEGAAQNCNCYEPKTGNQKEKNMLSRDLKKIAKDVRADELNDTYKDIDKAVTMHWYLMN